MMPTEKRVRVYVYMVHLYCDCGGVMLPTGVVLTTYPPLYPHRCQLCGKFTIDNIPDRPYPYVDYDPESGDNAP